MQLRPAGDFAKFYGVKAIIYGAAGSGKTPVISTCVNPVMLACEPGLLSMKGSTVPTAEGFTTTQIDQFFDWLMRSNEARNYDTIAIDSISQMAEIYLKQAESSNKHGLKAYGDMADNVMKHLNMLYYARYKHTYLISKLENTFLNNLPYVRPYLPGKELPTKLPHLFDQILFLGKQNVPNKGPDTLAFKCKGDMSTMSRDRTGKLDEFEPPDFGYITRKCTA